MNGKKRTLILPVIILIVSSALPPGLYWFFIGRAPKATPEQAVKNLSDPNISAVLADVRRPTEYAHEHIESAANWPLEKILAVRTAKDIPEPFKKSPLYLISDNGVQSARAALHLRGIAPAVYSIRGGMQKWKGLSGQSCPLQFLTMKRGTGESRKLQFQESTALEQWAVVITAFLFKPIYMLLSFLLAFLIRKLKSPDMVALRWALISFFTGEAICSLNFLFFNEDSRLLEYFHSLGMVLSFALATYALFEGLDLRVVKYSDPRKKCAALNLCDACHKYADVPCAFRRLFLYMMPIAAALTAIPLLAKIRPVAYTSIVLGSPYTFLQPAVHQMYEIRYCPALALVMFAGAFFVLLLNRGNSVAHAKVLFAAGAGFFGFSMFRLVFFAVYQDNLGWYVSWEEISELMYIVGTGIVLWLFRGKLFRETTAPEESGDI